MARAAAGTQAYVVGAIGPSGYFLGEAGRDTGSEDLAKVKAVFLEQARALLEGGVDALVVETIRQTPELRAAVEAAVEASEGRVPVIASASLDDNGRMAEGTEADEIARLAREWGASIVGVNCSDGPMGVLAAVGKMVPIGCRCSRAPNAGLPRRVDERMVYVSTPEYFGVYARRMIRVGARLVGGCCGTTPEHIRRDRGRRAHGGRGRRPRDAQGRRRRARDRRRDRDACPRSRGRCTRPPLAAEERSRREDRARALRRLGRGEPADRARPVAARSRRRRCCATAASTSSTSPTARARRRA